MATLSRASLLNRTDELRAVSTELHRTAEELCGDLMSQLAAMQQLVAENHRLRDQRGTPTEPTP